jgi:hypothetical protein
MPFKKGGPGGPGRPKGSPDVNGPRALDRKIREAILRSDLTPLMFLTETLQDENLPYDLRLEAARAAAPYVHQKCATKIDLSGEVSVIPPTLPKRRVDNVAGETDS